MRKILILAANPRDTTRLRLGEEVRDISEGLKRASRRDEFQIVQQWAVRPRDLQRAMLDETPQIVHFSGHGDGEAGLYFEDESGQGTLVTGSALAGLFRLISQKTSIDCVVLNGCYSQAQAEAIVEHVPYVVGMNDSVGDRAAIEFAVGFYDALGSGSSVEFAFESGKVAMELHSTGDVDVPVLLKGSPLTITESKVLAEPKVQPKQKSLIITMLGVSCAVSVITTILRLMGFFMPLELAGYDFFMRRPLSIEKDSRIVIVGITDDVLDKWKAQEISDQNILTILQNINESKPSVIGLDIFRYNLQDDSKQQDTVHSSEDKNYKDLAEHLENPSSRTVSTCLVNERASVIGSEPPFEINDENKELIGFSTIVDDDFQDTNDDGKKIIRRQLLSVKPDASLPCYAKHSLSYQIALTYLANTDLVSERNVSEVKKSNRDYVQLDETIFTRIFSGDGGYASFDDGGYQILINYRIKGFDTESALEILNASKDSEILKKLKDKIVLVGYTSKDSNASNPDIHNTPIGKFSGVELHAHMIRNIISPVNEEQPLIIIFPIGIDFLTITYWSFIGGNLIWLSNWFLKTHKVLTLVKISLVIIVSMTIIIFTGYWLAFSLWGWWLPLVPSITAWLLSSSSTIAVNTYKIQRGG